MAIGQRIKFFRNRKGMTQKSNSENYFDSKEKPQMSAWLSMNLKPEFLRSIL